MKLVGLTIREWRNLRNVVFEIAEDSTLVCLVGENGTGKSNVLELASAIAHLVGISPGIQMSRGNPFEENCDVAATIRVTNSPQTFFPLELAAGLGPDLVSWNGMLSVEARRLNQHGGLDRRFAAGGLDELNAANFGQHIINVLTQRRDTHHLYLDSDRSYPPLTIHPAHVQEAIEREWENPEWKRHRAFLPTRDL
jgi:ABC-type cobalamin/Fe3+-siderophores transport system ATPase subunit